MHVRRYEHLLKFGAVLALAMPILDRKYSITMLSDVIQVWVIPVTAKKKKKKKPVKEKIH